jgi:limonene 1,2-monooxygenase
LSGDHDSGLKFGVFLPPMHKVGLKPNLAIRRSVELIEILDRLGYDEVWVGEHHSGGVEILASPELVIAAAAERTKQIRLGTGVISVPYHHPFQVAERMAMLSHLTQGRFMAGLGPGQLASDARMLGIDPVELRPRLETALEVILALLAGDTVSREESWFTCKDATLQVAPYAPLEVSVVGTISPSGPKLAGRHGVGLLSLAATDPTGTDRLPEHWQIWNEEAVRCGRSVSRDQWRLMGPIHVAETVEEAKRECRYGLEYMYDVLAHITPSAIPPMANSDALVDFINETGRGVIGTPEMAVAQIERLAERSGGFGAYLVQGADFSRWDAKVRSLQLFAEEVIPRFTGELPAVEATYERVMAAADDNRDSTAAARDRAREQWQEERQAPHPG